MTPSRNQSNPPPLRSQASIDRFNLGRRGAALTGMQSSSASQSQTNLALQESDLNTIPDPRSPSPHLVSRQPSNNSIRHPDLSNEVATLSTKLINAINLQTNLDDQLQSTRHELDTARDRITLLESQLHEHESMVERGLLVKRSDSERIQDGLRSKFDSEHKARSEAEREKKAMELELENLTSALFEEANGMVATARQEKDQSDRKGEQLQAKLDETHALLASHQEQLRDLKAVMQQLQSNGTEGTPHLPPTPVLASTEKAPSASEYLEHDRRAGTPTQVSFPEAPLSYSHLIQPVIRTDLASYEDFLTLLRTTQHPSSRATSGTFSGLNVLGLGARDSVQSSVSVPGPQGPSNSSDPTESPSLPGSFSGPTPSFAEPPSPTSTTNLKDTRFYKRVLAEDIEPTLRLDTAPGLSWLARRSVLSAMLTGNLIIEPFPSASRFYTTTFSCSMCGETRKEHDYIRRHRFKTSDSEDAQTYALCDYCLARVRATCDFMGFMRLAKKGHYRNETFAECRYAWEESVRLRERMFWSRLGGGVVPANSSPVADPTSQSPVVASVSSSEHVRPNSMDGAIRTGRTLGGLRKRESGSRHSLPSVNGNLSPARHTSSSEAAEALGSKLNPSYSNGTAPEQPQADESQSTPTPDKQEEPSEITAPATTVQESQAQVNGKKYNSVDLAHSPAASPEMPPVREAEAEKVTVPDTNKSEPESPQLKPALPGPDGSLRQFPRNRQSVNSPGSPPKSRHGSPALSFTTAPSPSPTTETAPAPKMSKVASMAAKFQQANSLASSGSSSLPLNDGRSRVAATSPARSINSQNRSPSRPRGEDNGNDAR